MPTGFEDIAFATAEQFRTFFKWSRRSNITAEGSLAVSAGRVLFIGREAKIDVRDPIKVAVVPVPLPWLYLAINNGIWLLLVLSRTPQAFSTEDLAAWAVLMAVSLAFLLPISLFVIAASRRERWVEVVYADEKGQPQQAYFTPMSQLGWWPTPERVEQFCEALRSALGSDSIAEPTPAAPPDPGPDQGEECVTVLCEACRREGMFLAKYLGTVQRCPHCDAFVDVE